MSKSKLSVEEQSLLDAVESGEYESVLTKARKSELENAADEAERRGGMLHRTAKLALQRLDGIHDQDDKHVEASMEALDLATEGLDQQALALRTEVEAAKLREERDAMQKALNDNAKVMAEMQAMMKQMLDNK